MVLTDDNNRIKHAGLDTSPPPLLTAGSGFFFHVATTGHWRHIGHCFPFRRVDSSFIIFSLFLFYPFLNIIFCHDFSPQAVLCASRHFFWVFFGLTLFLVKWQTSFCSQHKAHYMCESTPFRRSGVDQATSRREGGPEGWRWWNTGYLWLFNKFWCLALSLHSSFWYIPMGVQ